MPKPTPVRLAVAQVILGVPNDSTFTTSYVRDQVPSLSPQTITNYLTEFTNLNAIERMHQGKFRVIDKDKLFDIVSDALHVLVEYRAIKSTGDMIISEKDAPRLNRLQRTAEALYNLGHPEGKVMRDSLKEETERAINELQQLIKNLRFKNLPKYESLHRIRSSNREAMIARITQDFPHNATELIEQYNSYFKEED